MTMIHRPRTFASATLTKVRYNNIVEILLDMGGEYNCMFGTELQGHYLEYVEDVANPLLSVRKAQSKFS